MDSRLIKDALSRLALSQQARDDFVQNLTPLETDAEELISEEIALEHRCQHGDWDDLSQIIDLIKTGSRPYLVQLIILRAFSALENDVEVKRKLIEAAFESPNGLNQFCVETLLTAIPHSSTLLPTVQAGFCQHTCREKTMKLIVSTLVQAARSMNPGGLYLMMMPVLRDAIVQSQDLAFCVISLDLPDDARGAVFRVLMTVLDKEKTKFLKREEQNQLMFPIELVCPVTWYVVAQLHDAALHPINRTWLLKVLAASNCNDLVSELTALAAELPLEQHPKRFDPAEFLREPKALPRPRPLE